MQVGSSHLKTFLQNLFVRYKGFKLPPCTLAERYMVSNSSERYYRYQCDNAYSESFIWWHVIAAKLAFVLIFEHLVFFIKWTIEYLIPDVPYDVKLKVQREDYLQVERTSKHFSYSKHSFSARRLRSTPKRTSTCS